MLVRCIPTDASVSLGEGMLCMQTIGVAVVKVEMSLVLQSCRWVLLGSGYGRGETGVLEPSRHGCVQDSRDAV